MHPVDSRADPNLCQCLLCGGCAFMFVCVSVTMDRQKSKSSVFQYFCTSVLHTFGQLFGMDPGLNWPSLAQSITENVQIVPRPAQSIPDLMAQMVSRPMCYLSIQHQKQRWTLQAEAHLTEHSLTQHGHSCAHTGTLLLLFHRRFSVHRPNDWTQ